MKTLTASQVKERHLQMKPGSHFFDRKTFQFFGDSMRNFGVRQICVDRCGAGTFTLYRKRPVKHGLTGSWTFDYITGELSKDK